MQRDPRDNPGLLAYVVLGLLAAAVVVVMVLIANSVGFDGKFIPGSK